LYAYLGDTTEAQDVVQEAFVRAWQRWQKIGEYDDPVAWVRRVAWNLATSRHRRVAVARRFLTRSGPPENQPEASPDHVALVAALRLIPEQQRRAMVMHYLADLPIADIAHDIGVAEGTVKSWLHRGRAELAKHLADDTDQQVRPKYAGDRTRTRPTRSTVASQSPTPPASASVLRAVPDSGMNSVGDASSGAGRADPGSEPSGTSGPDPVNTRMPGSDHGDPPRPESRRAVGDGISTAYPSSFEGGELR
ncbi:MAG: RNA polymerase sigma factor, partial [Micromonosporaceae bacterium]